jgi:hypothetical protein
MLKLSYKIIPNIYKRGVQIGDPKVLAFRTIGTVIF